MSVSPSAVPAEGATEKKTFPIPDGVFAETVVSVKHYTDRLFKFRVTRPPSFRFRSGEFVMIGLPNAEKPVFRAYSVASPSWDEELEFFSIKVPNGPLTEHLQKIQVGDTVLMRKKPTGTLVLDALVPGKRLYMFSTGTGVAPFASLIRDPETYEKFDEVILTQTCREVSELAYIKELVEDIRNDPLVGEFAAEKLTLFTSRRASPMSAPNASPTCSRAAACSSCSTCRRSIRSSIAA
ncbi:Ferredoxin--NADP reductase [Methylobrevis pamukkalensis]|uniref:ferredoxin--NADP(+) reductase n=1 Tax=Methylobrevis pamukkalensis TaxID=1439726 RepID=A0A1E3H4N3_9HYPH|nr:Ferredoxin--NADP reductase [Methylobrevis pamukkalensis]